MPPLFACFAQALVALEGADDSAQEVDLSQAALDRVSEAEECFAGAQDKVRCFDTAVRLLEQAEARVHEAQNAMKVGTVSAVSRATFQEALARYEGVLSTTVASSFGADDFLEACRAALVTAREVERTASRARRRVRALAERRRRELARLDRPAAALMALDLSELTEKVPGEARESNQAIVEAVRDAISAIAAARKEVADERQEREEEEEAALAGRVDGAIQAAADAEHAFLKVRERVRRAERWRLELVRHEVALARLRGEIKALPYASLLLELCAASMRSADESLAAARHHVAASATGGLAIGKVETTVEETKEKIVAARGDAEQQASFNARGSPSLLEQD